MIQKSRIVAIDGPAGAGKSTVARLVARRLGFLYIDTGALYRALTLKALDEKINLQNKNSVVDLARKTKIDLKNDNHGGIVVNLDGRQVTKQIRSPRITGHVSDIAKIKEVRKIMLGLQRSFGEKRNAVLDGRDIGTVVFPEAYKKFYLDAKFKTRIQRRYKELKSCAQVVTLKDVAQDVKNRDTIDSTRKTAPLKCAKDAIYIDTTRMTINEVVERILHYINDGQNTDT